jgi:hypothetical protein
VPVPADDTSPGRTACEAFWEAMGAGPDGEPLPLAWAWAGRQGARDAWEAAAEAVFRDWKGND